MSKTLIIYYSRKGQNYFSGSIKDIPKGNTEIVCEYVSKACHGDLFEVQTIKEYSKDYNQCIEEAKKELQEGARPELKKYLDNIDEYDNIVIGGPCWWGTYPCAVFSLIEKIDFSGKNIFPIMTHEGSGMGSCVKDLEKMCKGAMIKEGLAIYGHDAHKCEQTVLNWVKNNIK